MKTILAILVSTTLLGCAGSGTYDRAESIGVEVDAVFDDLCRDTGRCYHRGPSPEIVISVTPNMPESPDPDTQTAAYTYASGAIHVQPYIATGDRDLLRATLLHEIGHANGLTHEDATCPESVMFPKVNATHLTFGPCDLERLR